VARKGKRGDEKDMSPPKVRGKGRGGQERRRHFEKERGKGKGEEKGKEAIAFSICLAAAEGRNAAIKLFLSSLNVSCWRAQEEEKREREC